MRCSTPVVAKPPRARAKACAGSSPRLRGTLDRRHLLRVAGQQLASYLAEHSGQAALADDSGLCVDALGGAPGVISAHYAPLPAPDPDEPDREALRHRSVERVTMVEIDRAVVDLCLEHMPTIPGKAFRDQGRPGRVRIHHEDAHV